MKKLVLLGVAAAMLAIAGAGMAYPTLTATTGIVGLPTAYTVPSGQFQLAADVIFYNDTTFITRLVYGLNPNFEVGAGLTVGDHDGVIFNAKYRFPSEWLGFTPALGLAYSSMDDNHDSDAGSQIYLVGSRQLIAPTTDPGMALTGSLGVSFTELPDFNGFRPFVGAQLFFNRTEVAGEFALETGDLGDSILSMVVRHRFSDTFSAQAGFTNAIGLIGASDHDFFIGANFSFSGVRSTTAEATGTGTVAGTEETTTTVCPPPATTETPATPETPTTPATPTTPETPTTPTTPEVGVNY